MPKFAPIIKASADGETEILLHGPIGRSFWSDEGITGKEVTDAINATKPGTKITLGVNSQGGSVGEGLAIFNAINRRSADITVRIDGYALSIASFFPLAAGRIVSPKSSVWMIHKAWSWSEGNADDMRKSAELLDTHDAVLINEYVRRTGKTKAQVEKALSDETWLTGEEAVDWGLADEASDDPVTFAKIDGLKLPANVAACIAAAAKTFQTDRRTPEPEGTTANDTATSGAETTKHTMNKDKILALLKQHGKKVADDATEEGILAALGELVAAGKVTEQTKQELTKPEAGADIVSIRAELAELKAKADGERKARITAEVNRLVEDRPSQKADAWITKAIADESVLDLLRAIPAEHLGAEPVARGVENKGNPLIESYNKWAPVAATASGSDGLSRVSVPTQSLAAAKERIKIRKASAHELARQFERHMPKAGNTISSTIKPDALVDALVVVANNRLASLSGFSRLFTPDTMRPGASLDIKKATAGSTGQSNPSSWESGDSTLDVITVSLAHKTQSFQISQSDANYGFGLDDLAQINAQAFANLLSDVYTAVMTTANYGATTNIGAAAAFDADGLKPVLALAKNYRSKNLILDGGHLSYLLPTNREAFTLGEAGAYGFDLIAEQNRWTSAATNAVGFVCSPDALAVGAGAPAAVQSNQFETYGTFQIAELGLTVLYTVWFNTATRIRWASYEIMFGAAAGDTTQAEVLASA